MRVPWKEGIIWKAAVVTILSIVSDVSGRYWNRTTEGSSLVLAQRPVSSNHLQRPYLHVKFNQYQEHFKASIRKKRYSVGVCTATSALADTGAGAGIGAIFGPVGAAIGALGGLLFAGFKDATQDNGCHESDSTGEALKSLEGKIVEIGGKIDNVGQGVNLGRQENQINHEVTQDLIDASRRENDINFEINRGLINTGRQENQINFQINRGLIQQGREENLANFAKTQGLVNLGRFENQVNFEKTQGLINQGRVENFVNFKETQGLINEGRRENLMNFAITQDLVNQGRAENRVNFAITHSLINRAREENQINFQVTQGLVNQGRKENMVNFAITQDLINQGRWENLINFKAVQGSIAQLRDDTLKGFSFLSKQADRNLDAIVAGRLETMQGFNNAYKLLDRNFDATNAGRVENLRNFEITKRLINQIGDAVLRNQAQAMIERRLFYTSTTNLIRESANETINAVTDAKREILKSIDKNRIEPILSQLISFLNYFTGEMQGLKSSTEKQVIAKLQEPNGFLYYLIESRTPRAVNSLHSLLSDIINQRLAIPKNSDDELALLALDALFYGTQTYASVLAFLMEAYSFLAYNHYQNMELMQFNSQVTLVNIRYADFRRSLNNGVIDQVKNVLLQVQKTGYVQDSSDLLETRLRNLESLKEGISAFDVYLKNLQAEPPKLQRKPEFSSPKAGDTLKSLGPWKPGRSVSYAVQYRFTNGVLSRVGEFSSEAVLAEGLSNPKIYIPSAPAGVQSRLVFRKFDNTKPELVGSIDGNKPATFHDINKDLFNAAGSFNENLALSEMKVLLDLGSATTSRFDNNMTALHKASAVGNTKITELLFKAGADLDATDGQEYKPIHYAAENGYSDTLKLHVQLGVNANSKTIDDMTSLHLAAFFGQKDTLEYLLSLEKTDVNSLATGNFTALHLSVMAGHAAETAILLAKKAINKDARDSNLFTPLHHAVTMENSEIAGMLLSHEDLDVNAKASGGLTPLHLAAISGNKKIVDLLLAHKRTDVMSKSGGEYTPLHMAAANGQSQIVQSLLARNLPGILNARSSEKWTPLHLAISFKKDQAVTTLLLQPGIDIEVKADGGLTPLHLAAGTNQGPIVSRLLLLGANVEQQSDLGLRPLHYAAWYGRENATSILLRQADVNSKTKASLTPLHLAVVGNNLKIVQLLTEDKSIQVNSAADSGATPLHFAAAMGRSDILLYLLKKGADINIKDASGRTALDVAIESNQHTTIKLLQSRGAQSSACIKIGDSNQKNTEGFTPVQVAAAQGDLPKVQELLSCGADVSLLSDIGSNALHEAAYHGKNEVVAPLIDAGIDKNAKKTDGWAAIHLTCLAHDPVPTLNVLLQMGADSNLLTNDGLTALDVAVNEGKDSVADFLRSHGAKRASCIPPEAVNLRDHDGWTKLHKAASDGNVRLVKDLIACGAQVDILSHIGSTALHEAAYHGKDDVIVELLKGGSNINKRKEEVSGWAAIHLAALVGHLSTVNLLITKGAEVNLATLDKQTALDIAVDHGQTNVANLLKQHAARFKDCDGSVDVSSLDSQGQTPLHYAASQGDSQKVKVLLRCGASSSIFNSAGSLPLHEAAFGGFDEAVRELLRGGADPNTPKRDGATPLTLASGQGRTSVVKILLGNGGNPYAESALGSLPIHEAAYAGNAETVKALLDAGVDPNIRKTDGASSLHLAAITGSVAVTRTLLENGANVNIKTPDGQTPLSYALGNGRHDVADILRINGGH